MHSFRVGGSLSKLVEGTAVDIMKIGRLKTAQVPRYYIGTTSAPRGAAGQKRNGVSKRQRESDYYATAMSLPLSSAFQEDFAACTKRQTGETQ